MVEMDLAFQAPKEEMQVKIALQNTMRHITVAHYVLASLRVVFKILCPMTLTTVPVKHHTPTQLTLLR